MIHVEYAGSKPQISYSGISFEGKQDKYNFINPSIIVLNRLLGKKGGLNSSNILETLYNVCPEFDKLYENKISKYKEKLDLEEAKVQKNVSLSDIEKNILLKNYQYMRDYRVQRATNKLVYEEIINSIVELIKDKKIQKIKVPFSMSFLHVLESINTTMQIRKVAMSTNLDVKLEDKDSYVELLIRH